MHYETLQLFLKTETLCVCVCGGGGEGRGVCVKGPIELNGHKAKKITKINQR